MESTFNNGIAHTALKLCEIRIIRYLVKYSRQLLNSTQLSLSYSSPGNGCKALKQLRVFKDD